MEELWKDIAGYEGRYQVSNTGRVRKANGKELKHDITRLNRHRVVLFKGKERKAYHVHRLVAQAFIPNPNNLPIINHKNENPEDNRVENLEWCTQRYNINYGTRNLKLSLRAKPVKQISEEGFVIAIYRSCNAASKLLGYDFSTLYKCCKEGNRHAYGYSWEYTTSDGFN